MKVLFSKYKLKVNENILSDMFKHLYTQVAYELASHFKRKKILAITFIIVKEWFLLQLHIDSTLQNYISKLTQSTTFIKIICFMDIMSYQTTNTISYILFGINIIIFLTLQIIAASKLKPKSRYFLQATSIVIKSYEYIIAIPTLYFSFKSLQNFQNICNIPLTLTNGKINSFSQIYILVLLFSFILILGLFFLSLDYSMEFIDSDFMSKYDTNWNLGQYLLDLLMIISFQFFQINVHLVLCLVIDLIKLNGTLRYHIFHMSEINQLQISLQVFKILFSLNLILSYNINSLREVLVIIIIILIPMTYKIASLLQQSYYAFIIEEQDLQQFHIKESNYSLEKEFTFINFFFSFVLIDKSRNLDVFCRLLAIKPCFIFSKSQQKLEFNFMLAQQAAQVSSKMISGGLKNINIQNVNLLLNFQIQNFCNFSRFLHLELGRKFTLQTYKFTFLLIFFIFYQKYFGEVGIEKDRLFQVSDIESKFLIGQFITTIYRQKLSQKLLSHNVRFSYIMYVLTISQNICLTYSELISISNDQSIKNNLKMQQKMKYLSQLSLKYQNIQETSNFHLQDMSSFNLYALIDFEEQINNLKKDYYKCVEQLRDSFILLGQYQIDLNQANQMLQKFYDSRQILFRNIKTLLNSNNQSDELKHLCYDYDNYLSPNTSVSEHFDENKKNKFLFRVRDYYNSHSCLLQFSLLKEDFGIIRNISKNFRKVFKCNDDVKIIGVPLSQFVPACIVPNTYERGETLISDYLHVYNKILDISFLIVKTNIGFALPVVSKIQTQAIDGKQFGLVAWVKPIIDKNMYIVLDKQKNYQIETISEDFVSYLYEGFQIKSDLQSIKIDNIIPILLGTLRQSKQIEGQLTTILIKPQNKLESINKEQINIQNIYKNLQRKDIFKIELQIKQVHNDYQSYVYITIFSCQHPFSDKQRRQLINNYLQQYRILTTQLEQDELIQQLDSVNEDLHSENIEKNLLLKEQALQKFDQLKSQFQSFSSLGSESQQRQKQTGKASKFQIEFLEKSPHEFPLYSHSHFLDTNQNNNQGINDHNLLGVMDDKSIILDLDVQSEKKDIVPKQILIEEPKTQIVQRLRSQSEPQMISYQQINLSKFKEENLVKQSLERNILKISQNIFVDSQKDSKNEIQKSRSKTPTVSDSSENSSSDSRNNERASVQNSVCSSATNYTQKSLIRSIHRRIKMRSVKIINVIGIVSLLVIVALNIMGFKIYMERLIKQSNNFKYINWLYQINIHVSQSYSEYNIKLQEDFGLFKIADAKTNKDFKKFIQDLLDSRYILSRDLLIANQNCTINNIEVFQILNSNMLQQTMYSSKTSAVNITVSMLQSIIIQNTQLFHFIYQQDPLELYRYSGEKNYPSINSKLRNVVNIQNESYMQDLEDLINQQVIQLYIIIPISFIFFAGLVPIYAYIRIQHQKIIELFATIEPDFLKVQLNELQSLLQSKKLNSSKKISSKGPKSQMQQLTLSHNSFLGNNFGDLKVSKKGNISSVTNIKYSITWLIAIILILFGLNITYPITTYGILQTFMENSKHIYRFNNAFQEAYFLLINCLRARQGLAISYLLPSHSSQQKEVYQKLFTDLVPQIQEVLNQFKDQIDIHHQIKLHNQPIFDDFIINLLQNNACATIESFPQYQNGDFNRNLCESVGKNILQKGFYDGIQMFYLIFIDNSRFIFQDTPELYRIQYDIFNRQINGYNQLKFKGELTKIMDYALNFFQEYNYELYTYYELIGSIAFALQMVFLIIIYFFGWRIYYNKIDLIIFKAKELLDILPRSVLFQNKYILTFLQQNK